VASASELARAFAGAWGASAEGRTVDPEVVERLAALCETVHHEAPDLAGAIDDCELVAALAARAPADGVVAYLDGCHATALAIALAASRGNPAAIAAIERNHHGVIEAVCWRHAGPAHTPADLRQILREKLFVAAPGEQPRIGDYLGHGQFESWLRITAVRTFLDLAKRKDRTRESRAYDDELAMPDPKDLLLEVIKAEYRTAVRESLHAAAAELDLADRHLLHQHFVAGLTIDQLGVALGIHRATAARRVVRAREALIGATRGLLAARLELAPEELDDVIGMVMSRLDVSIPRLLQPQ
jgi:RNA polymerase sigma-70 factor, ECF subfamily